MLTGELVRASLRNGRLVPRWVDPSSAGLLAQTEHLIELFRSHRGGRIGDLEEAIADHIGDSTDYSLTRGLAKLLMDRATVEVQAPRPPPEVRQVVFRHAAAAWPVGCDVDGMTPREEVLASAAAELELTCDQVEAALYADLKAEERLIEADLPEPVELLERYNLGLAQALLLRAREVRVELERPTPKRLRQLFRAIKFHRLMHRARRTESGYALTLDGPLSLFRHTRRYGLRLALFLPALCLCERWSLEADVEWGEARRVVPFALTSDAGLVTTRRDTGAWTGEEERHFARTFRARKSEWKLRASARVIDLDGRGVLVPDYELSHPDGRRALLDIVWHWRLRTFRRYLELLRAAGPPNLIVALATRLNADEETPDIGDSVVCPFKGVIQPQRILAIAEEIATRKESS